MARLRAAAPRVTAALPEPFAQGWREGPSWRRQVTIGAVLLGHVTLLWLTLQARRLPAGSSDERQLVVLRLVPPKPVPHQRVGQASARAAAAVAPGMLLMAPQDMPAQAPAVARDGPAPQAGLEGSAGAAWSAGPAASAARGLDLRPSAEVLRGALANPATLDPRSNSPKPTFEERIAMGLDPELCVKLVRDDDGVVRRRMGRLGRAQTLLQSSHGVTGDGVRVCE